MTTGARAGAGSCTLRLLIGGVFGVGGLRGLVAEAIGGVGRGSRARKAGGF